ncbi:MAG: 30S ribosomal protein S7 [Candidatus Micrarchaeota archaeon]|nr:30S ribosomal protein S7 [Candidatus Micrarchaeota archaeon]
MAEPNENIPAQQDEPKEEQKPKPKRARPSRQPRQQGEANANEATPHAAKRVLLFDKYEYNVEVQDLSLKNYINLKPLAYPSTYRRGSGKSFSKVNVNIVERLSNSMMRGGTGGKVSGHIIRTKGRLQGKKIKSIRIIEKAFETVAKQTGKNPLQVLVMALENSAPIEDTTRVVYGGIKSNVAVDISASRRLDIALRNIAMSAIISAFGSRRSISDALANELVLAANMDVNSYAVKRKNEIERMARSAK